MGVGLGEGDEGSGEIIGGSSFERRSCQVFENVLGKGGLAKWWNDFTRVPIQRDLREYSFPVAPGW